MGGQEAVGGWERGTLVDDAIDCFQVAEAASIGPLEAMRVVLARCRARGIPDVTLDEVVRSWAASIG